jgi:hypothetical protein
MEFRSSLIALTVLVLAAAPAFALNPDDELWIPAAARASGNDDSFWITDLYIMNLGEEEVTVDIEWLERDADNSDVDGVGFDIAAGETLVLEDAIFEVFGEDEVGGAFHLEVESEDDKAGDEDDEAMIVATARIYHHDGDETYGQGFEAVTSGSAISADGEDTTHVIGVTDNEDFRSNWYGLNISEDEAGEDKAALEAEVMVELLDLDGNVLASRTYEMQPMEPLLRPLSELAGPAVTDATLRFTMLEGIGLFGASRIDRHSNDPITLEAHWQGDVDDEGDEVFTDEFFIEDCTFASTGRNPFFILEPGFQLVLEGEDEGEEISATVDVLDETFVVDGVECRVVTETEMVDGELEEISRNYFAHCVETGSVFYFGEHVDIYDDGVVVSHEGEWLAGEDGAEPGIIMPGTILIGGRYQQETAPGVAMDRGEIVEMGLDVETEAGTFSDCVLIVDTSPFDPGSEDEKVFCPGIGNVIDEELELVSYTDPSAD